MKKVLMIPTVFLAVVLFGLPCGATPKAVPVDAVFEFTSLPEGENITHVYIVRNTGDTDLNITNVLPP